VGLVGITCTILLREEGLAPAVAVPASLGLAAGIGLFHGLLIAKVRIQPFIVTLCGLFFYRGITRLITGDGLRGFGTGYDTLKWLGSGYIGNSVWPAPFVILLGLAAGVGAFMHFTAMGRHIFALGANEEAARFSGLRTDRLKIWAYVICSVITGVGGLLIAFKVKSLGPSDFGSFYELYAIAGAVLGGCSLRGGQGSVPGVLLGAALIVLLRNMVNILGIPSQVEYMVIGGAILVGVVFDEFLGRRGRAAPA
jgi:ribose transport system permease protein